MTGNSYDSPFFARIAALATAIPTETILQKDAAGLAQALGVSQRWHRLLPALYRKSGVQRRASVLLGPPNEELTARQSFYEPSSVEFPAGPGTARRMAAFAQHAGHLLESACLSAVKEMELPIGRITHLITVSCTGFSAPGVDHHLIDHLNLSPTVQRFQIGFMGCHGLINGLRVAELAVRANPNALALVGAIELCSLHQQYTEDSEQLVASSLFSDGAACALVTGKDAIAPAESDQGWEIQSSWSYKLPDTGDLMSWRIADHGFQMSLSPLLPQTIAENMRNPLSEWLRSQGLVLEQIQGWAIHPGGPRILDAVAESLNLSDSQMLPSRTVLAEYGNMSSPTVAFILERLARQLSAPDNCLMLAFGPGLHIEAMLLRRV